MKTLRWKWDGWWKPIVKLELISGPRKSLNRALSSVFAFYFLSLGRKQRPLFIWSPLVSKPRHHPCEGITSHLQRYKMYYQGIGGLPPWVSERKVLTEKRFECSYHWSYSTLTAFRSFFFVSRFFHSTLSQRNKALRSLLASQHKNKNYILAQMQN